MAAGKWKVYDLAKKYLADGTLDLDAVSSWRMALYTSISNCNTLSVGTAIYSDITGEVANANGYLTGGVALTSPTWTNVSGTETFDISDAVWLALGGAITGRFAVIYWNGTLNGIVKPLLCVCLMDTTPADVTATTGNTLTVSINASGVFTLSGATVD